MTDAHEPEPAPPAGADRPPIPIRVTRLREQQDAAPDYIAPLAAVAAIVAVLGTTCLPLGVANYLTVSGGGASEATTLPAAPAVPRETLIFMLAALATFFVIAVLGFAGAVGSILRREWGRRLMLAYAGLTLLYLITAIYFRMRFGIEGTTQTAPTGSALALNLTCVGAVLILVAGLMVTILRYFTLPHVARRFRSSTPQHQRNNTDFTDWHRLTQIQKKEAE